jgi:hypothetical protein
MVGNIKDVQEKATKMAKDLGGQKKTGAAASAAAAQYSLGGQVWRMKLPCTERTLTVNVTQVELLTKGFEQYGVKVDKSKDQLKDEIEPWMVPPSLIDGFAGVPGAGSDYTETEIKDKFKEAYNALSDDQKKVRND